MVRESLALLLGQSPGVRVVAQAANGTEAVCLAAELSPDVAVVEVANPVGNGAQTIRAIRVASPRTAVVALSMQGDEPTRRKVLDAGALGYVLKSQPSTELVAAIQAVRRGEVYLSPVLPLTQWPASREGVVAPDFKLSQREQDVLRFLVAGHRTRQIAESLCISPKTVETYRSRLLMKCGARHLVDLIKLAIRGGLVSDD